MENTEAEGFTFCDGVKPTCREADDLFRIYPDQTLCYAGWAGHMAFCSKSVRSFEPVIFVDYAGYLSGKRDYIVKRILPERKTILFTKAGQYRKDSERRGSK